MKMWPDHLNQPVVVLVGPTAVGKTEISLQIAERLPAEIVSADSRLFYRGMDIGTAKPSVDEMARVPHHLIDVADPDQPWSLATFQSEAQRLIRNIHNRGGVPLLVGGSGQYVRAVIEGWQGPPYEPDAALREYLERWAKQIGPEELHKKLERLDPDSAKIIDARNVRRTIRAIEVILISGKRFSEQRKKLPSPYTLLIIGLIRPRSELFDRVDRRIDAMLEAGLINEVQILLTKGYSPGLSTMSAIGYREIVAYLRGRMTLAEAVAQMKRLTRRFVRHQGAWFSQNDPSIHWFNVGPETVEQIIALIQTEEAWINPGGQIGKT